MRHDVKEAKSMVADPKSPEESIPAFGRLEYLKPACARVASINSCRANRYISGIAWQCQSYWISRISCV